jgi:hypothetical protein
MQWTRKSWLACSLILAVGAGTTLSLLQGQEQSTPPKPTPAAASTPETERPAPDLSKLTLLQKQMYQSAQRGGDWLRRANRADGRFVNGYVPDLRTALEGDHYLRQAGAAFAVARAARFLKDDRLAAVARQAVLTLLVDTDLDAKDAKLRHTSLPSLAVNRLASAGLLVMTINELPAPGEDLLEQSEQLCAYIRRQQLADGSLSYADAEARTEVDPEGVNYYPGQALYGLMLSQRHRSADWKTEIVRKALPIYSAWWRDHKSMALVPWQAAAYTEAFLLTKEPAYADFVMEMNDWMCELQYVQLDPSHPLWVGGFMDWADGKPKTTAPQVNSAAYAEGLAEACRVVRQIGDLKRYGRYRDTLERSLQFLCTLQYTDANTQHFADWYRPVLLGAFHASHQDGNIRIDYTQHAVCALVQYLAYCGE